MTNPQNNSDLAPWKWAFIGGGSTIVLALAGFGLYNLLNPKTSSTSTSTSVATATPENSVAKQLIGQWQGQSLTLIFTQEGKLFVLDTPTSANELEYQIDVTPQPKHLDILVGGKITARTIFDFTADGELRLELNNLGESRATHFSSKGLFQKISEQTALPANVIVRNVQAQQNSAKQSEAKQYLGSMNRSQQAYYINQSRFTSSLQELGIGIKSETENYSYSLVLSNDQRFVQSIGLAKRDGLKNYTGIVYLVKSASGEQTTSAILCQSNEPSKELPGTPAITNNTDKLQCPFGYSEVLR